MCNCEFDPYPEGDEDFGEESTHFHRTCLFCGGQWWGLHCPHDGYQNNCPDCGKRPVTVPDAKPNTACSGREEQRRERQPIDRLLPMAACAVIIVIAFLVILPTISIAAIALKMILS